MITREKVFELVQQKGPIIPSDLTSELKENTMIIGAFLSELIASKLIKISNAKVGGSPAYYIETQKSGLEQKLYPFLNEKNKRAFDILKNNDVIQDEPQSPLMKTALRAIPDFAVPFKVTFKGKQELFWKYFLTSDEIVKTKVKQILAEIYPTEKTQEPIKKLEPITTEVKLPEQEKPTKLEEIKTPIQNKPVIKEIKKEEPINQPIPEKQKTLITEEATEQEKPQDEFLDQVEGYLNSLKMQIKSAKLIKKNKELDLVITVPSAIGTLTYFCKARNKKKSNEGDIAQAFVEGQLIGLPTIYISNGDIPKKLESELNDKYKNLKILKL